MRWPAALISYNRRRFCRLETAEGAARDLQPQLLVELNVRLAGYTVTK